MSVAEEQDWFGLEDLVETEIINSKDYEFITEWECRDGTILSIDEMSTNHLANSIKKIKQSIEDYNNGFIDKPWRASYLPSLEEEYNKRKTNKIKNK